MEITTVFGRQPTLSINVYGDETKEEYLAAQRLKTLIESSSSPEDEGQISLHSNVILWGQKRRNIDILLLARFPRGLRRDLRLPEKDSVEEVGFFNVVAMIEVKGHPIEDVDFRDLAAWVRYRDGWSNATTQSEEQKESGFKYFDRELHWSPFVCNVIWFLNVEKANLPRFPNNFLASNSTFNEFLEKFCQATAPVCPYFHPEKSPQWSFYCMKNRRVMELVAREQQVFGLFAEQAKSVGALTRRKLEKITRTKLLKDQNYAQSIGERLVLIRGRAGTGKTIKLLHIAYDLCVHRGQRVLILTYNRMLVSDLQRMIALSGISSDLDSSTVEVETVHRFIRRLLEHFEIAFESALFIDNYNALKGELLQYLSAGAINESDIEVFKRTHCDETNWQTVLIDEGQDWPDDEKQILFRLFSPNNFVVASGTGQFVRSVQPANWTREIKFSKPPAEKRSLRQKRNLCEFQRLYAEKFEIEWDLEPSDDLTGGKIVIVCGQYDKALHDKLFEKCKADGNRAYEYLFLVPPSLTVARNDASVFALTKQFEAWGIRAWDGINHWNRTEYPTNIDEHRVVSYDSARGLEGWTVVCMALDEFVEYKLKRNYIVDEAVSTAEGQMQLGMKSRDERIRELAHEWVLIALTRAIDTTVITLSNPSSLYSRELLKLAHECEDFVEIVQAGRSGHVLSRRTELQARLPSAAVQSQQRLPSVQLTPVAQIEKSDEKKEVCDDLSAHGTSGQVVATVPAILENKTNSADTLGEGGNGSVQFPLKSMPRWTIKLFFKVLASKSREFGVQVSRKYVDVHGESTSSGPPEWRETIGSLVEHHLLEVIRREHSVNDKQPQGKECPRVGEFFLYRITDAGFIQATEWARQVNEQNVKRKSQTLETIYL